MAIAISILLLEDDPNGVKIIEVLGGDDKAFIIPRPRLKAIKDRPEVTSPAIYFLFGEGEDSARKKVYIGESETFYSRLENHDGNKYFWNIAVVFTGGLNRAHVKYLENKAVQFAKKASRYEIVNQIEPLINKLSDFDKTRVETSFKRIEIVLCLFGFPLFETAPTKEDAKELLILKMEFALAKGALLESGEFIVFRDSTARIKEVASFQGTGGAAVRKKLEAEGVLKRLDEEKFIFIKDHIFSSPSAAANAVAGSSNNGWIVWKTQDGTTLSEIKRK